MVTEAGAFEASTTFGTSVHVTLNILNNRKLRALLPNHTLRLIRMPPRLSFLHRALHPALPAFTMARAIARATPSNIETYLSDVSMPRSSSQLNPAPSAFRFISTSSLFDHRFQVASCKNGRFSSGFGPVFAEKREYRNLRRRSHKKKEKELELDVKICIEEQLPDDPEILVFISLSLLSDWA